MAFTVHDYQDLLSLLNAHPEWREELRRALLSDDFLALPKIVRELAAAQKCTEERVEELAAAQKRTEEQLAILGQRVDELAAAQKRTEERVEELAAAQKRTEERLDRVEARLDGVEARLDRVEVELGKTRSELGRLSSMLGASLEDEAGSVTATVMRQKGYRVLQEAIALRFNGEVDVLLPVEDAQGRRLWVLVEAKARLSRKDVLRWVERVRSPGWRKALRKAGCEPPYLVYVYAIRSDLSAREAVEENGIGLIREEGEIVAPAREIE